MRVLIAGIDGYLGWSLAVHLSAKGHTVAGIDALLRREWVKEVGSMSAIPISDMDERVRLVTDKWKRDICFQNMNLKAFPDVRSFVADFIPDCVVHLGEMPSAPYSMIDAAHAVYTQGNNLIGTLNLLYSIKETCPDAHLLKLGTMGEYGTPNLDIPEGDFEVEYRGRKDAIPFPRQAGSWYHQSKVHDSANIRMACKLWGLRSTDVMQGIVYGTRLDEMGEDDRFATRFDYDGCFGTAINRFCAQAVLGQPITPYGSGRQSRGFLPLKDSIRCLTLAIENPPKAGEYRVFNQFADTYSIMAVANRVCEVADRVGFHTAVHPVLNPRIEQEDHYYNPDCSKLKKLGYRPTTDIDREIETMIRDIAKYRHRIIIAAMRPTVKWDGSHGG